MKKYFLKGVDEPLSFGDTIEFDVEKEGENGQSVTKHVKTDFIPEIIPMLLDLDVIEGKEETIDFTDDKEDEEPDNTENPDEVTDKIIETLVLILSNFRMMDKRIDKLEEKVNSLEFRSPKNGDIYISIKDYLKRKKIDSFEFPPLHNFTVSM